MSNMELTLLEEEQIYEPNRLKIFDKIGTKASPTDFAIACGAYAPAGIYTEEGTNLENRTGWYWTKTDDGDNDARVVNYYGNSF